MAMTVTDHGTVLRRLIEAAVTGDAGTLGELVTDNVSGWSPNLFVSSSEQLREAMGERDQTFSNVEATVETSVVGDIAVLDDRLSAFTIAESGHDDVRPVAVFARDGDGNVVAGIHGWTWGQCCELVTLWVEEPCRGKGIARTLLGAAEQEARDRG